MRILKVTWRDSHRYVYQMEADENVGITTIETIGFFVKEDKEMIVLCQDDIEGDLRGVICIPKENIIKKKWLK